MGKETFYESLMRRSGETAAYKGKLIIKAEEVEWHTSPQGRNAVIVDETTGMNAKCFGMLITELPPGRMSGLHTHPFEAVGYVLEGEGREIIGGQVIDWKTGDTFYLPPNVPHRHINRSADKVARFIQIESWPLAIFMGIATIDQLEPAGEAPEGTAP